MAPQDEDELSPEDQELIAVYGKRIHVVRWCFENDLIITGQKQSKKKQSPNKIKVAGFLGKRQNRIHQSYDDYDSENDYDSED